jgi:hypothetical protein
MPDTLKPTQCQATCHPSHLKQSQARGHGGARKRNIQALLSRIVQAVNPLCLIESFSSALTSYHCLTLGRGGPRRVGDVLGVAGVGDAVVLAHRGQRSRLPHAAGVPQLLPVGLPIPIRIGLAPLCNLIPHAPSGVGQHTCPLPYDTAEFQPLQCCMEDS